VLQKTLTEIKFCNKLVAYIFLKRADIVHLLTVPVVWH